MAAAPIAGTVPDPTVPADHKPFDVNHPFSSEDIRFRLVRLQNGKLGFAVSFAHIATPDLSNWVHHMVVLGRQTPVASSTSDTAARDAGGMLAFRSVQQSNHCTRDQALPLPARHLASRGRLH